MLSAWIMTLPLAGSNSQPWWAAVFTNFCSVFQSNSENAPRTLKLIGQGTSILIALRLKEHGRRGSRKKVRARRQGGALQNEFFPLWHGYYTHETAAVVVTCIRHVQDSAWQCSYIHEEGPMNPHLPWGTISSSCLPEEGRQCPVIWLTVKCSWSHNLSPMSM